MVERAIGDPHHVITNEPALRDVDDPAELRARLLRILECAQHDLGQRRAEHARAELAARTEREASANRRLVPIPSGLIRMGFFDWVARRRREALGGKLFEPRKYSRIWNEGVLPTAGVKRDDTVCYSFRHTFEDGVKELVEDETKRRLMGHAEERSGGRYGNGQITRDNPGASRSSISAASTSASFTNTKASTRR